MTVLPPLPSGAILIVLRTSRSSRLRLPQRQVSGAFGFSPPLRTARFNALASSQWHCYNGPDAVAALVSGTTGWRQPTLLFATSIVGSCHSIAEKPCPSLPYYPASDLRGGPRLVVELRLWASMQDSGRLRPQSNSTMQAGTANVCILSICGVGALQADRLGVSRPQLQVQVQVQVQVPGAEAPRPARPARQAILTVGNESMYICKVDHYQYHRTDEAGWINLQLFAEEPFSQVFFFSSWDSSPLAGCSSRSALRVVIFQHSPLDDTHMHPCTVLPRAKLGTSSAAG